MFDYKKNSTKLDRVNSIKYLGVIVDFNMICNSHIRGVVTGANRMIGLIKSTVGSIAAVSVKRQLFWCLNSTKRHGLFLKFEKNRQDIK